MRGVVSGLSREVDVNCSLQGYYVACSGNSLPTFRDNLSFQPSRVKNNPEERRSHLIRDKSLKSCIVHHYGEASWILDSWRWNHQIVPETSVKNYHYTLRNTPGEHRFQHVMGVRKNLYSLHGDTSRKRCDIEAGSVCCSSSFNLPWDTVR
jgi:hypothetical protein